jgi:hypothetical protein
MIDKSVSGSRRAGRAARLTAALRANLRRRKKQARGRAEAERPAADLPKRDPQPPQS